MKAENARLSARGAAVRLIGAVLGEGRMLSQVELDATLPVAERARAERLAEGVLRGVERIDAFLHPLMRKAPPDFVLNVLRLAVYERSLDTATHAVVNEAVAMVKANRKTHAMSGLVNAVLRALPEVIDLASQPVPKLPRWLRQPMVHHYGRDVVAAIESAHCNAPPVDLTPRRNAPELPDGVTLPNGSIRLAQAGQISALRGYDAGAWWVQDAAASMAVPMLAPKAGERVLDLCAAPGGKTMQMADAGADVTALDISGPRLERLRQNLSRTGLAAQIVVADALHWQPDALFDAILLDAPCSASGTIRRHPDLPFVKDDGALDTLIPLQAALIDRALSWLKPQGRLLYCTCSLLPQEGEAQIDAALSRDKLAVERPTMPWVPPEWITANGALRLRPDYWADQGGMDGFFMALLRPIT